MSCQHQMTIELKEHGQSKYTKRRCICKLSVLRCSSVQSHYHKREGSRARL